ncbi:hypothetical protein EXN66_Car008984 [Channa argus]|uniref:Uncharacterized protein n=1 Tax=Channa argus TaxID=215402 RepID=A0A6G1PTJ1_CHAAH|nr:hypothetical protein EXN66_Car008984 [Channa argus]
MLQMHTKCDASICSAVCHLCPHPVITAIALHPPSFMFRQGPVLHSAPMLLNGSTQNQTARTVKSIRCQNIYCDAESGYLTHNQFSIFSYLGPGTCSPIYVG